MGLNTVSADTGLTAMQEQFCLEYVKDFSATGAMKRAGYSAATSKTKGPVLMRNPLIIAQIKKLQEEKAKRSNVTVDEVVRRLVRIATVAEENDEWVPALRALELLGKHLSMFKETSELTIHNPFLKKGEDEAEAERAFKRVVKIANMRLVSNKDNEDEKEAANG